MELHKACDHFIIPHSIESHRSDAYYLLATGISHDDHIPFAKSQQVPQGAVIVQSFTGWMHSSVSLAAASRLTLVVGSSAHRRQINPKRSTRS